MRQYQDFAEARPDRFIRYDYPKMLDSSRKLLSDHLHASLDEIVLVPNATVGINTVLRNLRYNPGDKILYCSTLYGACEKTVEYVCETTAATSIRIELEYPLSDGDLLQKFSAGLQRGQEDGGRVKIAVFDVVSSLPGVRMPFVELTEMCKQNGVFSLIDGAHAPGQIPVDLGKLQPDFFVGNCHKYVHLSSLRVISKVYLEVITLPRFLVLGGIDLYVADGYSHLGDAQRSTFL
jgi:selenocysteine lyase/cysteine desulfurase